MSKGERKLETDYTLELWDSTVFLRPSLNMKYLYIELTTRCNLKCKMCFKQYWEDKEGDMDYNLFLKILNDTQEFPSIKMIFLGGIGEPTVYPKFTDAVKEIKDRGYALGLSTNGTLLNKSLIDFLINEQVDLIYFSMDALPVQSNQVRLGHVTSEITGANIKKIIEEKKRRVLPKPSISVEVVATKENYKQLPEMAKYLNELGVDSMLISNLLPMTEEQVNDIVYDGKVDMSKIVDELEKISSYGIYIKIPYFELKTERRCEFDENNAVVIRWDGEVSPCYRFLHTYYEYIFGRKKKVNAYSFGNVKNRSLKDIWLDPKYSKFRFVMKNYMYPSCTDCPLRNACDFVKTSDIDCWGNEPSCADCLWSRRLIFCPIPQYMYGKYF
ncbi:tungsten cofactor oxidoreductase radical SAM maturase [Fervidicoccus fontis]|uniref:Putative metallocofactor modifying protein, radical SAM superfamily n=1 Tax=Fervidicoccus fontis (strain DSM 19380 / JCM 18336 / VKM B-2539 / Kam940) TaxID=1163730 RepID=H9ZZN2_FERFK|nr:tungsten cofactor oxidoreductase radical SAM maturase [Fervidicoccus fontis]AFH42189.1 putative metallocofactor modifying protein, radical SAM superfamily [Fervidicoccus fontis Kam940]